MESLDDALQKPGFLAEWEGGLQDPIYTAAYSRVKGVGLRWSFCIHNLTFYTRRIDCPNIYLDSGVTKTKCLLVNISLSF